MFTVAKRGRFTWPISGVAGVIHINSRLRVHSTGKALPLEVQIYCVINVYTMFKKLLTKYGPWLKAKQKVTGPNTEDHRRSNADRWAEKESFEPAVFNFN